MYLNAYVPGLQTGSGFAFFLWSQLDRRVPSTFMIAPTGKRSIAAIGGLVETEGLDEVSFAKG
jgi:hypothetical protein